jgi:hypothetical protein
VGAAFALLSIPLSEAALREVVSYLGGEDAYIDFPDFLSAVVKRVRPKLKINNLR